MYDRASPFITDLVSEEIRRLVAEAIANGGILSTADCAERVMAIYPNCGLSNRRMADAIMLAAAAAGVAVEIAPPARFIQALSEFPFTEGADRRSVN